MVTLLLALTRFAFLDSLNVLSIGVTMAVVCDSRLSRRSPVPGGLSFPSAVPRRAPQQPQRRAAAQCPHWTELQAIK
jgi:hypothetical protein